MRTFYLQVTHKDGSAEQGTPFHMVETADDLKGCTLLAINPTPRPGVLYLHLRDEYGDDFPSVMARLDLVNELNLINCIGRTFE